MGTEYARIDTYVTPVVEAVCKHLGLRDSAGTQLTTDESVVYAAHLAYSQAILHVRAPLVRATYTERFDDPADYELRPSVRPVESVTNVYYMSQGDDDWTALTVDDDYVQEGDRIRLLTSSANTELVDLAKVVYVGGLAAPKDEANQVFAALFIQTIANYNRRMSYGMGTTTTVTGDSLTFASNRGGLVDDVRDLLAGFVVYDGGEILSVEDAT